MRSVWSAGSPDCRADGSAWCADLAEVEAGLAAGIGDVVLVDLRVKGLDREVITEWLRAGVGVVGLRSDAGASASHTTLSLRYVVDLDAPLDLVATVCESAADPRTEESSTLETDASWEQDPAPQSGPGRLVAVWGPHGAPGRSTLAVNLAAEFAARQSTVLVDADIHAPCLGQMLGVLDESPGIVAACRAAARDTLDERALEHLLPTAGNRVHLLSGIGVAARWPEVGGAALGMVLDELRRRPRPIVADVAAPLETDEELSYDTRAPQRNAATRTVLGRADTLLVVVAADPVSLTRLLREVEVLRELTTAPMHVVVNRRGGHVPDSRITERLAQGLDAHCIRVVPEDKAVRRCLWEGALLAEAAPRSPARRAIRDLAEHLGPLLTPSGVTG
jgi:MinD-like ATPase involved in chromosome partitioning or flagellar assembly